MLTACHHVKRPHRRQLPNGRPESDRPESEVKAPSPLECQTTNREFVLQTDSSADSSSARIAAHSNTTEEGSARPLIGSLKQTALRHVQMRMLQDSPRAVRGVSWDLPAEAAALTTHKDSNWTTATIPSDTFRIQLRASSQCSICFRRK